MANSKYKRKDKKRLGAAETIFGILIVIAFAVIIILARLPKAEKVEVLPDFFSYENATFVKLWMPAVDAEGKGIPTELTVEAMPGSGRIFVDIEGLLFWADTQQSIRIARKIAGNFTGVNLSSYDLVYNVYANASIVGGPSAGAGLAIATIAALQNRELKKGVMITGMVNHDGSIGPSGNILEKAKAAKKANASLLLVPLLQSREVVYEEKEYCDEYGLTKICTTEQIPRKVSLEEEIGIEVAEVSSVEEALKYFFAVSEAVEEARLCSARGAGITGGDPLLRLGRTIKYIKALKKAFGKKFHIHIYLPTENTTQKKLESLAKARVDEVRFHPLFLIKNTEKEIEKIMLAVSLKKKYKWKVGIEVPVIPKTEKALIRFIEKAKKLLDFVNLNELELSVLNAPVLMKRGMTWKKGSAAVKSSEQTAFKVLRWCRKNKVFAHYCSARTKDRFQYKNRLLNRLKNIAKAYDLRTIDIGLYRAALYLPELKPDLVYDEKLEKMESRKRNLYIKRLSILRKNLMKEFSIPQKLIEVDKQKIRLLTSVEIAKKVGNDIKVHGLNVALVEESPTYDKQILQLEWI